MTKVTKPSEKFWGTEKQPSYMKITKDKNDANGDAHIVRFEKEKSKKIKLKKANECKK